MDIESTSEDDRCNKQHRHEGSNYRLSALSVQRNSQRNHESSLKVSLIDAMDLEYPNDNDQFQLSNPAWTHLLADRRSSNKPKDNYNYGVQIDQKDLHRKSNYRVKHECIYHEGTNEQHLCNCWLTPNQICVIGQCSTKCIQLKNQFLRSHRGYRLAKQRQELKEQTEQNKLKKLSKEICTKNMHYMKQVYSDLFKDMVFCTCKKSHCQKKYCICFQKGLKCGQFCQCDDCHNKPDKNDDEGEQFEQQKRWERYAIYQPQTQEHRQLEQEDIGQYLQYSQGSFRETMQFEPVNFQHCYHNH